MKPITINNKYTFFVPHGDYRVHCHRYGEPWQIFDAGWDAVASLMSMVEELEAERIENKALLLRLLDNIEVSDMFHVAEELRKWAEK